MTTDQPGKTIADLIYDRGKSVGEALGRIDGKAEAWSDGILRILDRRGLATSPEQRRQITARNKLAQLELWFDRAITASTAAEVFKD